MAWLFIKSPGYLLYILGIYYITWVFLNPETIYYMSEVFTKYTGYLLNYQCIY